MRIKSLSLRSVRNYARLDVTLGPGINLFFGENARGKTNLLEAICYLGSLRSFRGARPADMVRWGERGAVISGTVHTGDGGGAGKERVRRGAQRQPAVDGPAARLTVSISEGKRRVALDGKRPENAAGYLRALKVSSFSPEDLFLVREYPSHRRRFLDRSIFHLHPVYLDLANEYRRALAQLNAALKAGDAGLVEAWEGVLAPLAAEVGIRRRTQAELLSAKAAGIFGRLSGGGGLGASYRLSVQGESVEELAAAYKQKFAARRAEAMRRGHCAVGPHSEDLALTLDGREMRSFASRGQARLALMALVFADCMLYHEERGTYPVLLLDDAASELDAGRRDALMRFVSGMGQAVLTATGRGLMEGVSGTVFRVEDDTVRPE